MDNIIYRAQVVCHEGPMWLLDGSLSLLGAVLELENEIGVSGAHTEQVDFIDGPAWEVMLAGKHLATVSVHDLTAPVR